MDLFCSETMNKQKQDIQRNNRYKKTGEMYIQ